MSMPLPKPQYGPATGNFTPVSQDYVQPLVEAACSDFGAVQVTVSENAIQGGLIMIQVSPFQLTKTTTADFGSLHIGKLSSGSYYPASQMTVQSFVSTPGLTLRAITLRVTTAGEIYVDAADSLPWGTTSGLYAFPVMVVNWLV